LSFRDQPLEELALLHGGRKGGHHDLDGHFFLSCACGPVERECRPLCLTTSACALGERRRSSYARIGVLECSAIVPGARWQSRPLFSTTSCQRRRARKASFAPKLGAHECPRSRRVEDMRPTLRWLGPAGVG